MKYMVISDIHGDIDSLNRVLDIYVEEKCSKLLVLGDLFNYGIDYYRDDIIDKLNQISDSVIAVSGNCDNNLVGILFNMPYTYETNINNKQLFLTHGHLYTKEYLSKISSDIIYIGHSHIAYIEKIGNKIFSNPGSISKPRRGEKSFIITDERSISIRNLNNETLEELSIIN